MHRLVLMSTLNEIPGPLGSLKGKSGSHHRRHNWDRAAAQLFVREGAYVFISGLRQKELDEAVKEIGSTISGGRVYTKTKHKCPSRKRIFL